jgi:response regulator NasT
MAPGITMTAVETPSIRIAVAEDEPASLNILVHMLGVLGHKVIYSATDGSELIEVCVFDEIDLVVVDLDMPIMDGLATAEIFANKGIPVILVSGHSDAEELVLEHEPVSACIRKPASMQTLRTAIAAALATRGE